MVPGKQILARQALIYSDKKAPHSQTPSDKVLREHILQKQCNRKGLTKEVLTYTVPVQVMLGKTDPGK